MAPGSITTLTTFGDLVDHRMALNAFCNSCDHFRQIDPSTYPASQVCFGRRWKCSRCNGKGGVHLAYLDAPTWR